MARMCPICGNKVKLLDNLVLKDGKICADCGEKIGLHTTNMASMNVSELLTIQDVIDYQNSDTKIDPKQYWADYKLNIQENKIATKQAKQQASDAIAAKKAKEKRIKQQQADAITAKKAKEKQALREKQDAEKAAKKATYEKLKADIKTDKTFQEKKVYLDYTQKTIFIDKTFLEDYHLFNFSNLASYKTIETPTTITKKHGITRSVVGGLVAGPTGAMLGAVTGGKSYEAVSKLAIILYFDNNYYKQVNYISTATKTDTILYRSEKEELMHFCFRLDQILTTKASTRTQSVNENDTTNNLRELKKLVDDGILTEEEFAAKKKQILGI